MQKLAFPNLHADELLTEAMYHRHLEIFPDGQFVALDGDRPAGSTTTLRVDYDFSLPDRKFMDMIDGGWLGTHQPDGEWLYGADVMVHPEYRRRGIARQLYEARAALVRRLGLRGQVAAGMIPGYHRYADQQTVEEYSAKVVAGELTDPTLSAQLKIGFRFVRVIHDYLHDPTSGNASALIVWDNDQLTR